MKLNIAEPNRIDNIKAWLSARHLTHADVGQALGITAAAVTKMLNNDHARPERVAQLREIGIPEDLLPEARYITPGRKPKKD